MGRGLVVAPAPAARPKARLMAPRGRVQRLPFLLRPAPRPGKKRPVQRPTAAHRGSRHTSN